MLQVLDTIFNYPVGDKFEALEIVSLLSLPFFDTVVLRDRHLRLLITPSASTAAQRQLLSDCGFVPTPTAKKEERAARRHARCVERPRATSTLFLVSFGRFPCGVALSSVAVMMRTMITLVLMLTTLMWTAAANSAAKPRPINDTARKHGDWTGRHGACVTRRGEMSGLPSAQECR